MVYFPFFFFPLISFRTITTTKHSTSAKPTDSLSSTAVTTCNATLSAQEQNPIGNGIWTLGANILQNKSV